MKYKTPVSRQSAISNLIFFGNKIVAKMLAIVALLFAGFNHVVAQTDNTTMPVHQPEMADTLRSNGKIYVVVTVLVIVLTGLFLYVIRLDRKISKLEKTKLDS